MSAATLDHPRLGRWQIEVQQGALVAVRFVGNASPIIAPDSNTLDFTRALLRLMDGTSPRFELPYKLEGSPFFQRVWKELERVPYGEVTSYAALAKAAGNPNAYRAAGSACARNPLAIVVPCHRVLASNGGLGGYAYGLDVKESLLAFERRKLQVAA